MSGLEPGSFSNSGPGLPSDRRVEPAPEPLPEQEETDRLLWPLPRTRRVRREFLGSIREARR